MAESQLPGDGGEIQATGMLSGSSSGPIAPKRDPLRERLLLAMAQSCSANGYRGVTTEDLLARAALSHGDFDARFLNLDDCFDAAITSLASRLIRAATGAYSPDKPLVHVVRDASAAVLEVLAVNPAFARMAFVDAPTATPRSREQYRTVVGMLSALLDQLRVDSTGYQPPAFAARAAVGGAEAVIKEAIVAHRADELPGLLPDILYGTLVPFLGQGEALRQAAAARKPGTS